MPLSQDDKELVRVIIRCLNGIQMQLDGLTDVLKEKEKKKNTKK